jgi:hypothetical protein
MERPPPTIGEAIHRANAARVDAVLGALGTTPTVVKQSVEYAVTPGTTLVGLGKLLAVRVDREFLSVGRHGTDDTNVTAWALVDDHGRKPRWEFLPDVLARLLDSTLPAVRHETR